MTLVALDIPAGVVRNGTDLQSAGRWRDASLVRWEGGSLRPIGGWRERVATAFDNAPRGMHVWESNNGSRYISAGTYNKLFAVNAAGTVTDISPSDLVAGILDAAVLTGYGNGLYGTSFYGTARPDTGNYSEATTWSIDNWGEYLVACSTADGRLLQWQLNTSTDAAAITNAPTSNLGLIVTEERFIFALGAGGDPRKVQWCDQEAETQWSPASTNQAGSQILQTNGQIMTAQRADGQTLILTDIDMHRAVYVGAPFIYTFERVGSSCGIISRKAAATVDAGTFWMGQKGFFFYDGSKVRDLPCAVDDYVFADMNPNQVSKTWATVVGQHSEVWWFYCSADATEIDRYVSYNYSEGHWSIGQLSRTTGVDRGVFKYPLWCNTDSDIIEHEVGLNYDGSTVFAESGPAAIGTGENLVNVLRLIPDEKTQGDVTATFKTRLYPNAAETSHGPYSMANPTSVRFSGRQVRMRVEGARQTDWRVGIMRADVKQAGRR